MICQYYVYPHLNTSKSGVFNPRAAYGPPMCSVRLAYIYLGDTVLTFMTKIVFLYHRLRPINIIRTRLPVFLMNTWRDAYESQRQELKPILQVIQAKAARCFSNY